MNVSLVGDEFCVFLKEKSVRIIDEFGKRQSVSPVQGFLEDKRDDF